MLKYNTTMSDNPNDAIFWLTNLIEELLDAANYAERLIQELKKNGT